MGPGRAKWPCVPGRLAVLGLLSGFLAPGPPPCRHVHSPPPPVRSLCAPAACVASPACLCVAGTRRGCGGVWANSAFSSGAWVQHTQRLTSGVLPGWPSSLWGLLFRILERHWGSYRREEGMGCSALGLLQRVQPQQLICPSEGRCQARAVVLLKACEVLLGRGCPPVQMTHKWAAACLLVLPGSALADAKGRLLQV